MQITYTKIIELILFIVVLINLNIEKFFNINFGHPIWISMVLILLLLILTKKATKRWSKDQLKVFKYLNFYVLASSGSIIIEFIYSIIKYKQSFMDVFMCVNIYIYYWLIHLYIYLN
jgi:hypothetical protein